MSGSLVSIIIRCYNEEEHIGRLLSGIFEQSIKEVQVIIVDSGSTDRTLSIASNFPAAIYNISPEEFSFGRALNIGCAEATGEFVAMASAHVYPTHRRWLEYLLAPFQDPRVALAYGKQRGNGHTIYSEHKIFCKWFPETSVSVQKSPFCNNANAAIRRSLWKQIPYNEELTGLEDLEWAKRVIQSRYYLAYVAEAEVIHVHNESYTGTFNRYYREAITLHSLFPEQKFRIWDCLWLWFLNTASDYIHSLRDKKLKINLVGIPKFRWMQFWGTYRGYAQRDPVSETLRQRFYYPNRLEPPDSSQNMNSVSAVDYIDYSRCGQGDKVEPHC